MKRAHIFSLIPFLFLLAKLNFPNDANNKTLDHNNRYTIKEIKKNNIPFFSVNKNFRITSEVCATASSSATLNLSIPDDDGNGAVDSLNINSIPLGAIIDSVIITFTITHTFLQDIDVNVQAPNGNIFNLAADHDCADPGGYQQTRISSDNSLPALPVTSNFPITGTYKADGYDQSTLNSFSGDGIITTPAITTTNYSDVFSSPNGQWKIRVYDVTAGDVGTLVTWSIKICYTPPISTPVSLITFSGYRQGNSNILKWTTASEQNNKGFQIERSADGLNFSSIGFINSLAQSGNSSSELNYSFTDYNLSGSKQYYRLRQLDLDGNAKLSNVILIKENISDVFDISGIFPNPVNSELNITVNSPMNEKIILQISDMNGKIVIQRSSVAGIGSNTISTDVSALRNGIYVIKVLSSSGETATGKFVRQ